MLKIVQDNYDSPYMFVFYDLGQIDYCNFPYFSFKKNSLCESNLVKFMYYYALSIKIGFTIKDY